MTTTTSITNSTTKQLITREQLFASADEIWKRVPLDIWDAINNKLRLTAIQGISTGPIGTRPDKWPVIIKPVMNAVHARTTNKKFRVCVSSEEYDSLDLISTGGGNYWMPFLSGEECTLELLIRNGQPVFSYSLNYMANQDYYPAPIYSNIEFNKSRVSHIPGWDMIKPALARYSGPLSIYYIGQYIISMKLRWSNWSEYIWESDIRLSQTLDKIIKLINLYTSGQDLSGLNGLVDKTLESKVINCIPIYLQNPEQSVLAKEHWEIIAERLAIKLIWLDIGKPSDAGTLPCAGIIVANSVEKMRKVNKYKLVSQMNATDPTLSSIPIVI